MPNPITGEVGCECEGQAYVLVLDVNAMCVLEAELGLTPTEISEMLGKPLTSTATRALFYAALQEHHEGLTLKEAGKLVHVMGPVAARAKVFEALAAAWGSADEDRAAPPVGPRKRAKAGTG